MKHSVIFLLVLFSLVTIGTVAQTQDAPKTETTINKKEAVDMHAEKIPDSATSKVPRAYPIAAGVWYPGDPLPEKPFRYYRMRCWPGCHHNSEYGMYPDKTEKENAVKNPHEADKK